MKRAVLPLAVLLAVAGLPALTGSVASAAPPVGSQSTYVPVEPVRVLDTRSGTGAAAGKVGPGGVLDLRVADGVRVPSDATAVVLNVTATSASAASDVRVYPTPAGSGAPPAVSNLNVVAGRTVANLVTVKVGEGGRVRLRNQAGSVHLLADLAGWFVRSDSGATLVANDPPVRLLDTRRTGGAVGPGEVRRFQVAGRGGVPEGVAAVVLNVTATGATAPTDVRVYPTRLGPPPGVSNLNPSPGLTTAAAVVVPVGADGTVSLRNAAGRVHLVVDLGGRYVAGTSASVFSPLPPARVLDTRGTRTPLGPGEVRDLVVGGAGRVPSQARAVVLNVTATQPSAASDVRVYPASGGTAPLASNLNVVAGQTAANTVVAAVGRGGVVRLRNGSGNLHLVVDVSGWFGPSGDGWDISWPQCTSAGSTTSRLPEGGAFAVIGLTRGRPFTDNECFRAQWDWATSLPGEAAVYINVNAPGPRDSVDGRVWAEVCGTGTPTSACGQAYGERIAAYAVPRLPATPVGGRPMVWMDVEGPYTNGPFWQTGYAGAVAVNRAVIQGVVDGLRRAGYRVGTYSDRGSVTGNANDWVAITGGWRLVDMQNWVFRSPDADPRTVCGPEHSFSGGPVVMAQVQPATNPGVEYDVNGLC